jgi:glycosyltransferase involved in cell wall biosynthesis
MLGVTNPPRRFRPQEMDGAKSARCTSAPPMTPRVSVCLPTYKRMDFLPECGASIQVQSFGNFEVVAADNGSEDGTWEFLNDTAKADSRFRVFRNERQLGLVGNLNRVLAHARGEWIQFVLSDDFILPDCLRRLLAAADASGLPFAAARSRLVFEAGLGPEVRDAWATGSACQDDIYSAQPRLDPEAWCGHVLTGPTHNSLGAPTDTLIRQDVFRRRGGGARGVGGVPGAWGRPPVRPSSGRAASG